MEEEKRREVREAREAVKEKFNSGRSKNKTVFVKETKFQGVDVASKRAKTLRYTQKV